MSGNGDYISREAAFEECDWYANEFSECEYAIMPLKGALEILPAADVRSEVKSKWADNCVSFYRGCPECGAFVRANLDEVFLRDFPSAVGKLNFCPNCGADMRGESDA